MAIVAKAEDLEATSRALATELAAAVAFSSCELTDARPKHLAHDRFFHVVRVAPAAPARLLAVLEAIAAAARLVRASDASEGTRRQLLGGLGIALALATGHPPPVSQGWRPEGPRIPLTPMERWVLGHQSFIVLMQAAVAAHCECREALLGGSAPIAKASLAKASALLIASGAVMRLTGQMPPDSYAVVRAAMTSDEMPAGFSGLWSFDHQELLRAIAGVGEVRDLLSAQDLERWRRALDEAYDHHVHVCDMCVEGGPSLRMRHHDAPVSATASLENYRRRTLRLAGEPRER